MASFRRPWPQADSIYSELRVPDVGVLYAVCKGKRYNADTQKLLDCLHRLVDAGHTVIVIKYHLEVIKTADYIIDLGPEGGRGGGEILVAGTSAYVVQCGQSHTGRFLKEHL